jgi:hypothetical protein
MKFKSLLATAVIATTLMTVSTTANSANIAQQLCEYVSVDDKKRMRGFLKTNKLKIRSVFSSIKCNGQNLLEFADARNSVKVGEYIVGKLPKKIVVPSVSGLQNAAIKAKAESRIQ